MTGRTRAALALLAAATLLAGCSFSINRTVTADAIAEVARGALEEEYDITVDEMDCGEDAVDYVEDTDVDCVVTVEGAESDATVTITGIDGDEYDVWVDVPEASWLLPADGESPTEPADPPAEGTTVPLVTASELAAVTEDALEPVYGERPTVTCAEDEYQVYVGAVYECDVLENKSGETGLGTITITEVSGLRYSIDVVVEEK